MGIFRIEAGGRWSLVDAGELRYRNEVEIHRIHRRASYPMPDKQKAAAPKERRL